MAVLTAPAIVARRPRMFRNPAHVAYLAGALIVALGGWQIDRTRTIALSDAYHDARNLARSLTQHMERSIEGLDALLGSLVDRIEAGGLDDRARFETYLAARAKGAVQARAIMVLDEAGTWLAGSDPASRGPAGAGSRPSVPWHREHEGGGLHVGGLVAGGIDGEDVVPLSRRWNKPDGSFGGVVVAVLNPGYFQALYGRLQLGSQGVVALIGDDRRFLLRYPHDPDLAKRDLSKASLFAQGRAAPREGLIRYGSVVDRIERIAAYEHLDAYPATILAAQGLDDVLIPWRREAMIEGAAVGTAALGLVGLGFGLARNQRRMQAAEDAIRRSEAEHREILDTTSDAFVSTDATGTITAMNGAAERLFQWPAAEGCGRQIFGTLIPKRFRQSHGRRLAASPTDPGDPELRTGLEPGRRLELVGRRRDGIEFPVEVTVSVTGSGASRAYHAFIQDISERKIRERALAESEARFRLLAENTSELIILGHDDGRRSYISPAAERMLGYTPSELGRMRLHNYVHPDDLSSLYAATARLWAGEDQVALVCRAHHKARGWIWVEGTFRRIPDASNDGPSIVATFRDIGERRQHQAELEAARDTAERANRAKTEFLASMSHEIRTPLNGVIGFTGLILERRDLDHDLRRQVELIRSSGSALLTVVNDILDFSKIEAGEIELVPRPFAPACIVEEAVAIVRGQADANGTRLDVVFDLDLPTALCGDADRLRQVLLNLLNNAVKFTRRGVVTVTATGLGRGVQGGDGLRVVVEDTGIGIPADKLDRLFQRFSQVDGSVQREFGGTGLGLAISRRLVELMGGAIDVSSVEGRGSRFWFTVGMPRVDIPLPAFDAPSEPTLGRIGRILVVDDIAMNVEIARAVLEGAGHRVETAGDGADAIDAVTRTPYDLVLMDVQMPVLDGITATKRIRLLPSPSRHVPILAMTANVLPAQIAGLIAAGMDGHVGKPFRREDLLEAVAGILATGMTRNRDGARDDDGPAATRGIVVNRRTLAALYDVLPPAAVSALLTRLRQQLVTGILFSAAGTPPPSDLARASHNLVSSSGLLGFERLSGLCRMLETAVQTGAETDGLRRAVSDACREAVAVIDGDLVSATAA